MNAVTRLLIPIALLATSASVAAERAAAEAEGDVSAESRESSHCLRETGSRIKPSKDQPCINAAGRAYTREDIDRTGATTTAEALRQLSPSVR